MRVNRVFKKGRMAALKLGKSGVEMVFWQSSGIGKEFVSFKEWLERKNHGWLGWGRMILATGQPSAALFHIRPDDILCLNKRLCEKF
jgi:hypothetical protein